jgi:hypothetical protein
MYFEEADIKQTKAQTVKYKYIKWYQGIIKDGMRGKNETSLEN